jgi:hypothetical protein
VSLHNVQEILTTTVQMITTELRLTENRKPID